MAAQGFLDCLASFPSSTCDQDMLRADVRSLVHRIVGECGSDSFCSSEMAGAVCEGLMSLASLESGYCHDFECLFCRASE